MKSKSKIKPINITCNNSEYLKLKNGFNKKFNIKDDKENRTHLKNRCLSVINQFLCSIDEFYTREKVIGEFCSKVEILLGIPTSNTTWSDFSRSKLFKFLESLNLDIDDDYYVFMYFLEITINEDFLFEIDKRQLVKKIAEVLKLSNANVMICKNDDMYEIYPLDVEFLNNKLVIDVLTWLDDYPKAKKTYLKAIKMKMTNNNYRNIIDELRLSLELLFKQIFCNEKSLENQYNNLGNYFKQNNIPTEISNMYINLINLYAKFNNNNVKHNDNVFKVELDYMIYLTGSFIRFILMLEKSKQAVMV